MGRLQDDKHCQTFYELGPATGLQVSAWGVSYSITAP